MNEKFQIKSIGTICAEGDNYSVQLEEAFLPGLKNIGGFSHIQIVWWGHLTDTPQARNNLVLDKLFVKGPDALGVFATRSPARPNPILISTCKVKSIDFDTGIVNISYIDACDNTPVLDIKPYFQMERVRQCSNPAWCQHWPKWHEESITYNWQDELNKQ